MFEELIKQQADRVAAEMEAAVNAAAVVNYFARCEDWVRNEGTRRAFRLPPDPIPLPPFKVRVERADDAPNGIKVTVTSDLLTTKTVADFMPKYGTDTDAVGGPVGGPKLDAAGRETGRFHQHSDDRTTIGTVYVQITGPRAGSYVKAGNMFDVFWLRLA